MWWIQLIQMAVNMGLKKVEEDKAKQQANAFKKMAREEGAAEAALLEEDNARTRGRAATLAAASGGGLTGSAMDVLDDLGRQGRFRVRSALWAAESDAQFGARVSKGVGVAGAAAQGVGGLLSSWSGNWGQKAPAMSRPFGAAAGAGAQSGALNGFMNSMGGG